MSSMGIKDRTRSEEKRCPPVREVRYIGRESHHTLVHSGRDVQMHRLVLRQIFNARAARNRMFQSSFDLSDITYQTHLQLRRGTIRNHIGPRASADDADVAGGVTQHRVDGPLNTAQVLQYVEQFLNSRFTMFGIGRMRSASFGSEHE